MENLISLLNDSAWFQGFSTIGGALQNLALLGGWAISGWTLFRAKRRERRLARVTMPKSISDTNDQIGLVFEFVTGDPRGTFEQIKGSIPRQNRMKPLRKLLLDSDALSNSNEVSMSFDYGFKIEYLYSDEMKTKGRFIAVTAGRMPDNPQRTVETTAFINEYNRVINILFSLLRRNGVKTVHLFYHGPVPLACYLGSKAINAFSVYMYHFSPSEKGYFLLGSGDAVKDNAV